MRWLCLFFLIFGACSVHAHQRRTVRKVLLTVRAAEAGLAVDMAVWMRLGGHHARRTILRFDLDKSGDLNAGEAAYLGNELAPKALAGVFLSWQKQPLVPIEARSNARLVDDSTLEVLTLLSYTLSDFGPGPLQVGWRADAGASHVGTIEASAMSPVIFLATDGFRPAIIGRGLTSESPFEVTVGVYPDLMNALLWTLGPVTGRASPRPVDNATH